jgi:hypothetical protein
VISRIIGIEGEGLAGNPECVDGFLWIAGEGEHPAEKGPGGFDRTIPRPL